jgi:NAD(P) transhydrogenase subunit alpha
MSQLHRATFALAFTIAACHCWLVQQCSRFASRAIRKRSFYKGLAFTIAALATALPAQSQDPSSEPTAGNLRRELVEEMTPPSPAVAPAADDLDPEEPGPPREPSGVSSEALIASLTIFVLAIFVGFEVIAKVPPTLHTPLMSGSNAISGITIVGALLVSGVSSGLTGFLGMAAVALATVNVVGGFLVTHRMLAMFRRK